jgi:hypothetical protein
MTYVFEVILREWENFKLLLKSAVVPPVLRQPVRRPKHASGVAFSTLIVNVRWSAGLIAKPRFGPATTPNPQSAHIHPITSQIAIH